MNSKAILLFLSLLHQRFLIEDKHRGDFLGTHSITFNGGHCSVNVRVKTHESGWQVYSTLLEPSDFDLSPEKLLDEVVASMRKHGVLCE